MKERPILFSAPRVRAILEGRKTQTRRIVNRVAKIGQVTEFQPSSTPGYDWIMRDSQKRWNDLTNSDLMARCPCGQPGDRLWVRETWRHQEGGAIYDAAGGVMDSFEEETIYRADHMQSRGKWTPSIHMPRWVSRINLEIVSVRVERLQDISAEDAIAEGLDWEAPTYGIKGLANSWSADPQWSYRVLWESINGPGSWAENPWVFVLEFRRITP